MTRPNSQHLMALQDLADDLAQAGEALARQLPARRRRTFILQCSHPRKRLKTG